MSRRSTAALLAALLGGLGAHRFYLNRPLSGIVYALFCWTLIPSLIGLFEGISYAKMSDDEFDRRVASGELPSLRPTLGDDRRDWKFAVFLLVFIGAIYGLGILTGIAK